MTTVSVVFNRGQRSAFIVVVVQCYVSLANFCTREQIQVPPLLHFESEMDR